MDGLPLHKEPKNQHQLFVIVVAWFFTVLGATSALKALSRLIIMFWTRQFDDALNAYTYMLAVELLFSISAFVIGLGMLNRRANALRNSIVALWLYLLWHSGALTWGIIQFWMQTITTARLAEGMPELAQESFRSGLAYMIYGSAGSMFTVAVCFWLARKLSLPIIKNTYAT